MILGARCFILTITVTLYGIDKDKKETVILELEPGSTVETIVNQMRLAPYLLFVLNERVVNQERQLSNGDVLEVFPPLTGG